MKSFYLSIAFTVLVLFTGCTAEVQLSLKNDGTVAVDFKGSAGESFSQMIQSACGTDEVIFDTKEITYELTKAGLNNVNVSAGKTDISVSMTDEGNSFLFKSNLVQVQKNKISTVLNRTNLSKFYSLADEQLAMVLDLLLAPVFNDEEMSESEYLEVLGSFYGDSISKEVSQSVVKITLIGADGKKAVQTVPMTKILCIAEEISLHSSN